MQQRKPKMLFVINIYLIGNEIDLSGNFCFLTDLVGGDLYNYGGIDSVNLYTYNYEIDGLKFKKHNEYYNVNERFNLGGKNG